jgi:hypothetical protein
MRSDSPPPEWYEPPDVLDDDEPVDEPEPELLVIRNGAVSWTAALCPADDD